MQRASLKGCITPRQKFGKERVHPKVPFNILNLMSAALMLQNYEDRSQEETLTRAMRPQRRVGNGKRSSLVNQVPAASSQGPAASANSGDESSEFGDEKSVRSQTLEGQCFTQISIS